MTGLILEVCSMYFKNNN